MKLTQTLWIPFQLLTYVLMLLALYAIFIYAPVEKTMGVVQKIFYIHVPAAFLAYLAFFITFIASIFYLYRKDSKWDTVAHCPRDCRARNPGNRVVETGSATRRLFRCLGAGRGAGTGGCRANEHRCAALRYRHGVAQRWKCCRSGRITVGL